MNRNFKKFRENQKLSVLNVSKTLKIEENILKSYENERLTPKFELLTRLVQKTNTKVIITDEGDIEFFGDLQKNISNIKNTKKINIFKEIQEKLSLSKEEFFKRTMISIDNLSLLEQNNIRINIVKFIAETLKIVIIVDKNGVNVYEPYPFFDKIEIQEKNKKNIRKFSETVCSFVDDNVSIVNQYDIEKKTNKPIVFYAKTKKEFICKYLRIYDDLNGIELEIFNQDRKEEFSSFYEMEFYYLNNEEEFFSKIHSDFTNYKWDGENLYTLWGNGLYYTNSLQYVIDEIQDYADMEMTTEPNSKYVEELYDYIIENLL